MNRKIASSCCHPFQLVNVVSDPSLGNFTFPAVLKKGKLTIAVSTDGGSPLLARKIRDELDGIISGEIGPFLETVTQKRKETITAKTDPAEKEKLLNETVKDFKLNVKKHKKA